MLIDKKIERQTLILRLTGELDMRTSESLRQAIDTEIDRRGIRTVVLNLAEITFVDSSGLGVILGRYKKLLPLGGRIIIQQVPTHIYKIMELSGLPKIIPFEQESAIPEKERKGKAQ